MQQAATAAKQRSARTESAGAPLAAKPPTSLKARASRAAALWATLGFIGGAIFWHAIGSWNSTTLPVGSVEESAATSAAAPAADPIETGSLPTIYQVDPANCTSLELDRRSNLTSVRPCPSEGLALRLDGNGDREDLSVLASEYEAR
jgi:hypothetical protein